MIELFKEVITVNECEVWEFIPFAPTGEQPPYFVEAWIPDVEPGFETIVIL